MTDLEISMVVQAYGVMLDQKIGLKFSTIDKYKRQAIRHLENPNQFERPPHLDQAMEILSSYTS